MVVPEPRFRFRLPDIGKDLSPRERDVLALLPSWLTCRGIAHRLGIGTGTVKSHVKAIYDKLRVHTRHEAIARGIELGLIDGEKEG